MDKQLEQILKSKQSAIKLLSKGDNELIISKQVEIKGDATCDKLICNNIEVRSSGNKTLITNSIITKSKLDSTLIGTSSPTLGVFTTINIKSIDPLKALYLDGDINIYKRGETIRSINSLYNPLHINTNKYLTLNSNNRIDIISTTFNINTTHTTHSGIFHILNNTDSNSLSNGSVIINGGVAIGKTITIGGSINSLANTNNNIMGNLNVDNNISTNGMLYINNTNDTALTVNGGIIIKKNTHIYNSLTIYNNLNILNNNNSTNIINGNTVINNNFTVTKNINCQETINVKSLTINDSQNSINTATGSLIIKGGIGIGKNINIGGSSKINGTFIILNENDSSNINDASFITHGGAYIHKNININGNSIMNGKTEIKKNLIILDTSDSDNINKGSIVTLGGLSVKKNINMGGILIIHNKTESTNINTGSLVINGGVGIAQNVNIGGDVNIGGNVKINENLIVENYLRVGKNLHVESDLVVYDKVILKGDTDSFNINTGTFITNGGIGIKKNVNIGQDLNVLGNVTFNSNVNCIKTLYADNIYVRYNITSSKKAGEGLVSQPNIPFDTLVGNLKISSNISISNAFSSIDQWINRNLINTPPILVYTTDALVTSEFIQLEFELPTQIYVGFLNQKLPIMDSLYIDYRKNGVDTYTTINMNSITIDKIRIYPFTYNNYSKNNIFYLFNIEKHTPYDFRVYAKNNNINRPNTYLEFKNVKTEPPNLLPPPTNIIINNNINNSTKSIDLNWTHSISPNISIYQYNISYYTLNSIKYPNYIKHNSNSILTSSNIIYNSNNFTTINNLYPGHIYNVNIQAKNILNNNFGDFSSNNTIVTDLPIPPSYISNNNLYILNNNNYYFNINKGYSLNGNIYINNIYDYNKLDNNFSSNILENIRINENISTTDLNSTKIIANLDNNYNTNIFCNLNLNGFSHINNSTNFIDKFNIKLSNIKDFYEDEFNNGFYKTTDLQITFNNSTTYFVPSINTYILQIQQNIPFYNINYKTNLLYLNIDKIQSTPVVSDFKLTSIISDIDYFIYISGVPTVITGNVNFSFKTKYLTNNYLRHDKKHFNLNLITNNIKFSENNNVYSDHFKNSHNFYYNLDDTKHNNTGNIILPNTEDLLFKNQTIKINNINYTEDVNLNINAYNLHGTTHVSFSTKIRLDNESIKVINNINNANSSFGLYVTSGDIKYPNSYFDTIFDHVENISNTKDLQLVNGYFSTPYNINAFLNYTNYFNNMSLNYPNYEHSLINDSFRYITFRYLNILNDSNKITIEFIDTNINEILTSKYELLIKINDYNTSEFTTAWLDANKVIDIIGLNNHTKNINGTGCLSMFSNYVSTPQKKYCYLPNGSTGRLLVKLGFKNNEDFLIKYIKVTNGFI